MKTSHRWVTILLAAVISFATPGCKRSASGDHAATVSTVAKEKHTKTKAHKRDKKEEKAKGAKKAAKPA